jgi:penicillin-binding protein 1B
LVCVVWVGFDDGSQLGLTGAQSALPIWGDFMSAALTAHPEWTGDWNMPDGVQQTEIDPATGGVAQADTTTKRGEYFINGTLPGQAEGTEDTAEDSSTSEEEPQIEPASLPPDLSRPKATPTPKNDKDLLKNKTHTDSYEPATVDKLQGTITLDIDPTTGLIAVDSCPVIKTRTFVIGQEPRRYCGPEYHKKPSSSPRPR